MDSKTVKISLFKLKQFFFITGGFIVLVLSLTNSGDIQYTAVLFLLDALLLLLTGMKYKVNFYISPLCIFFFFYFFYTNTFPILYEYGNINFFSLKKAPLLYTYAYSEKFFAIITFMFLLSPRHFIVKGKPKNILKKQSISVELEVFALGLFTIEVAYFIVSGYLLFFLSRTTARTDINTYVKWYNIWSYLGYITIFLFLIHILSSKGKITRKVIIFLPIAFYYGISIFSGSRKQLLYLIVIITVFYVLGIVKVKRSVVFILLLLFIASFSYRVVVMDKGWKGGIFEKVASVGGEFIFPTMTFPLAIQKNFGLQNFNYPTLFDSVLYFVPRSVFPAKNHSIAETFSSMMDINMGFAANPMLEAYINFGIYGFVFEALLFIFIVLLLLKIYRRNMILYLFGLLFLIDLNRGEVSFYIKQIGILYFTLLLLHSVIGYFHYAIKFPRIRGEKNR